MSLKVTTNGRSPAGIQQPGLSSRSVTSSTKAASTAVWTRPSAWLPLPSVAGQQRFVGLHRIDADSNFVAFSAFGAYTVDWGDGTTNNYSSGATASKQYDYSTISSTGESTLGYRQVIIQVYPQAGQNITSFNLSTVHPQIGLVSSYRRGWLDIALNFTNLSSLTITNGGSVSFPYLQQATFLSIGSVSSLGNFFVNCYQLQSVPLFDTSLVTSMSGMFSGCYALKDVPLFNTASVINMNQMFVNCNSLQSVPLFNTAAVQNMSSMFSGCKDLQSVPLFNTASVTNMSSMFSACYSLQTVPLFNTASVTDMSIMFNSCVSLQSVPLFNTASVTNMSSMFSGCSSLQTVPLFNTAAVTNMSSMFANCYGLQSVPLFNTSAATTMNQMFSGCNSLQSVPLFNTGLVTNMVSMFSNCSSLQAVPLFDTSSATTMNGMFSSCTALTSIPALNTSSVIDAGSLCSTSNGSIVSVGALDFSSVRAPIIQPFASLSSLVGVSVSGIKETISFASCKLSSAALNTIYTNLADLTQGDASYASVTLLMRFGGNNNSIGFADLALAATITVAGNSSISTTQSKFGGSSGFFDGTGDYLSITANATNYGFGTGDYTVEAWLYITSYNSQSTRIFGTSGATPNFLFGVDSTGALVVNDGSTTTTFGSAGTFTLNQWHHIAFSRSGTSLRAYMDGSKVGNTATNSTSMSNTLAINFPATASFNSGVCYIDELRVTKGVARYTTDSTFAVPSASFPAYSTATKTITVTGNYGSAGSTTSIATAKGWTVVP